MYTVFDNNKKRNSNKKPQQLFFDQEGFSISRYDQHTYPIFEKLTKKQISFFWVPEEIDISKDIKDFRELSPAEQHVFTSNLKRQIMLDSIQGRSPAIALLPICTTPELENWILAWSFFESIHSRSYTHIIQNIYADPSEIFDEILDIEEIVNCAKDISKFYDELIEFSMAYNLLGEGTHTVNGKEIVISKFELKRRLWLALMSINVLEGIRFYVSFACSWSFTEQRKAMEGNAKIIKLICRDENLHLASTQHLLDLLVEKDPDFRKIAKQTQQQSIEIFESAVEQEKEWAKFLFKDGAILGLNEEMLQQYIEWLAHKRMSAVGLPTKYKGGSNPLPWTKKWIAGNEVQTAPQETQISSYTVGGVIQDVTDNTFKGVSL